MVVVDTSVWIDFLNGNQTEPAVVCRNLIERNEAVALTDIVLTEVLQGFNSDREAKQVEAYLLAFPMLRLKNVDDFVLAASLRREARRAGVSMKTVDCLIAAPCVRTGAPLLHSDKDFDRLAECTLLKIWK